MPSPDLAQLIHLFHAEPAELGQFTRIDPAAAPDEYQRLLWHTNHMTVTMELCHLSKVEVEVLDRRLADDGKHYTRKILLRTPPSEAAPKGRVVQFGIARMNLDCYPTEVREEVLSERTPLGRVPLPCRQ